MHSFLSNHKNEIKSNKKYILFSFFISIYVYLPQLTGIVSFNSTLAWFFSVLILTFLSHINKLVFVLVAFFTMVVSVVYFHLFAHWGDVALKPRLQVAMQSNPGEISEYFDQYIGIPEIIGLVYLAFGLWLLFHFFKNHANFFKFVKITSLVAILGILGIISIKVNPFHKIVPFSLYHTFNEANEWKEIIDKRLAYINSRRHRTSPTVDIPYNKIVIVLGESANRNHMSVYGYERKTTPFFDSLLESRKGHFFVFKNIISPANLTHLAVPLEFTDATVEDFDKFLNSESIITLLAEQDFETHWLSNQAKAGADDTTVTAIAAESDKTIITNVYFNDEENKHPDYDKVLLDYLEKFYKKDKKQLFVLHIMGSHFNYKRRYPATFKLIDKPLDRLDHYDNSIYYTDHFLKQLFQQFKNDKTLLIYLSDHAEIVGRKRSGHGTAKGYKDEFEIPLTVYSSVANTNLDRLFMANQKRLFNMESFNTFFEYIIGMEKNLEKISSTTKVMTLEPNHTVDYSKMDYQSEK